MVMLVVVVAMMLLVVLGTWYLYLLVMAPFQHQTPESFPLSTKVTMAPWPSPTPGAVVAHHGAHGVVVRHGSMDGTVHGRRWVVAEALMEVEADALRNVVHQGNDVREVHQVVWEGWGGFACWMVEMLY